MKSLKSATDSLSDHGLLFLVLLSQLKTISLFIKKSAITRLDGNENYSLKIHCRKLSLSGDGEWRASEQDNGLHNIS